MTGPGRERAERDPAAADSTPGDPTSLREGDLRTPARVTGHGDGPGDGHAPKDGTRVVESPETEEDLVAAPAWATLILVAAPFVLGFLVIVALRWLL